MSLLRPGRIIWAEIPDRNGHKKERPAVIAEPVPADEDGEFAVFAITTKPQDPAIPKEIPIRADPNGKFGTLLKKHCVVACWWPVVIKRSDIRDISGELSSDQIRIMTHFAKNLRSKLGSGTENP